MWYTVLTFHRIAPSFVEFCPVSFTSTLVSIATDLSYNKEMLILRIAA